MSNELPCGDVQRYHLERALWRVLHHICPLKSTPLRAHYNVFVAQWILYRAVSYTLGGTWAYLSFARFCKHEKLN